jgi:hypothetical protein
MGAPILIGSELALCAYRIMPGIAASAAAAPSPFKAVRLVVSAPGILRRIESSPLRY